MPEFTTSTQEASIDVEPDAAGAGGDYRRLTLTIEEVAQILGIGRGTAYAAARRGDIPAMRILSRWIVSRTALERMLETAGRKPTGADES